MTALHALAHTYEMVSDVAGGASMYQEFEGQWEDDNLLVNHVAWHKALFHIELGQPEAALALYDRFLVKENGTVAPPTPLGECPSDDEGGAVLGRPTHTWRGGRFQRSGLMPARGHDAWTGKADASSLLWRLGLRGVDVGERWRQLRPFYAGLEDDHVTSFNDMHMFMCLASCGNSTDAHQALASLQHFAEAGREVPTALTPVFTSTRPATNQGVLKAAGLAVSRAIVAFAEWDYVGAVSLLRSSTESWQVIGGSHAQRDVLTLTLIEACVRDGTDLPLAKQLLAERATVKDPSNASVTWTRLRGLGGCAEAV